MNDFPDWMNPVVVKELRQGTRTKVFLAQFLAPQILMIFFIFIASSGRGRGIEAVFWFGVSVMFLILMPLRALFSVSKEIKESTLNLLLLTNLSPRRIIFGKWLALFLQSLLLMISILPYVVLNYFSAEGDLVKELCILAYILAGSAVLTAGGLMISPLMIGMLGRIMLIVAVMTGVPNFVGYAVSRSHGYEYSWILFPPLLALLIEGGAKWISPKGINSTSWLRVFILGFLLWSFIAHATIGNFNLGLAFAAVFPFLAVILFEEPIAVDRSMDRGVFAKCPAAVQWFFRQGWISGTCFAALITLGFQLFLATSSSGGLYVLALGAVAMPLAICRLFQVKHVLTVFTLIQVVSVPTAGLLLSEDIEFLGALFPPVFFWVKFWQGSVSDSPLLVYLPTALSLFLPLLLSRKRREVSVPEGAIAA